MIVIVTLKLLLHTECHIYCSMLKVMKTRLIKLLLHTKCHSDTEVLMLHAESQSDTMMLLLNNECHSHYNTLKVIVAQ